MRTSASATKRLSPKQRVFLRAYSSIANVERAAQLAGVKRETHYGWKRNSPLYADAFEEARELAGDALEEEAIRRAQIGVVDSVFQGGKQVGTRRRFSDSLLALLLKAFKPEKYNTERHELSGPGAGPIQHLLDLSGLSDEDLGLLEQIASKAAAGVGGDGGAASGGEEGGPEN